MLFKIETFDQAKTLSQERVIYEHQLDLKAINE